jgi:hypothetical protein
MVGLLLFLSFLAGWVFFSYKRQPWVALSLGLCAMVCAVAITHLVWSLRFDYSDRATRGTYRQLLDALEKNQSERVVSALRKVLAAPSMQDGRTAASLLKESLETPAAAGRLPRRD